MFHLGLFFLRLMAGHCAYTPSNVIKMWGYIGLAPLLFFVGAPRLSNLADSKQQGESHFPDAFPAPVRF